MTVSEIIHIPCLCRAPLELETVLEQAEKYISEADEFDDSVRKLIEPLKEKIDFLKQLHELNDRLNKNVVGASKKALSLSMNELMSFMKEERWRRVLNNSVESRDARLWSISWKLNSLLKAQKERSSRLQLDLCERIFGSVICDPPDDEEVGIFVLRRCFSAGNVS